MRFPEWLYAPSASDVAKAVTLPVVVTEHFEQNVAAGQHVYEWGPTQRDQVLVLTNGSILAVAGGAQLVLDGFLGLQSQAGGGGLEAVLLNFGDAAGATRRAANWSGEAIVMPDERVRWHIVFDAGVAPNFSRASICGYILPRGNVQLGSLQRVVP